MAESRCAQVMYETRLPPTFYLPKEDVVAPLHPVADHRTFCPFKGTATYWDLDAPGGRLERAAWSYMKPLAESAAAGAAPCGSRAPAPARRAGPEE